MLHIMTSTTTCSTRETRSRTSQGGQRRRTRTSTRPHSHFNPEVPSFYPYPYLERIRHHSSESRLRSSRSHPRSKSNRSNRLRKRGVLHPSSCSTSIRPNIRSIPGRCLPRQLGGVKVHLVLVNRLRRATQALCPHQKDSQRGGAPGSLRLPPPMPLPPPHHRRPSPLLHRYAPHEEFSGYQPQHHHHSAHQFPPILLATALALVSSYLRYLHHATRLLSNN